MTPFITGFMDNKTEAFWVALLRCKCPDGAMLLSDEQEAIYRISHAK
jgi:hypothetical protein